MPDPDDEITQDQQNQIDTINERSASSWAEVADELMTKGLVTEFHPTIRLFAKELLRHNQGLIFNKLRENGYGGNEVEYIEINLKGPNGWAIFNPEAIEIEDAIGILTSEVDAM